MSDIHLLIPSSSSTSLVKLDLFIRIQIVEAVHVVCDVVRDILEDELIFADVIVFNSSDSKLQCTSIPIQFFKNVLRRCEEDDGVQSDLKI